VGASGDFCAEHQETLHEAAFTEIIDTILRDNLVEAVDVYLNIKYWIKTMDGGC
jgi:hypothetical protein